jgi:hypothetical protein
VNLLTSRGRRQLTLVVNADAGHRALLGPVVFLLLLTHLSLVAAQKCRYRAVARRARSAACGIQRPRE